MNFVNLKLRRKIFLSLLLAGGAVLPGIVFAMFIYYSATLPSARALVSRAAPESTKIFDRKGTLLYEFHGDAKRTVIALDAVPPQARQAAIAVEDKNFYRHLGFDLEGIARALYVNWKTGAKTQGASTITQQFVRNAILTNEKTWQRKFEELVLAFNLELRYPKDTILELYFNEIPYGSNLYGIEAASQAFFGKKARDLTLAESAYLAALPKAPTYYSPYGPHTDELRGRANLILQKMREQEFITDDEWAAAKAEQVVFQKLSVPITAPHFVFYVQDVLREKYGEKAVREGGLRVRTTLDLDLQKLAEEIITRHGNANEKNWRAANASLVALDPRTGQVLAMVGGRNYWDEGRDGEVNVALRPRQPGSSFKPYVYATAFKEGLAPGTMIMDVTTNFGRYGSRDYIPQNYSKKNYGALSIRQALQGSLNIPAVKTLMLAGIDDSIDTAEALGLTTLANRSRYGPSLVLGGAEVKLLEHTAAFGAFGQNGMLYKTTPILEITDRNGRLIEGARNESRQALPAPIAYQITNVLSDNEARLFIFSSRKHNLVLPDRPVAVKTGTTQEFRDAWTVGYTPSLAAGVWVGNNNNAPMRPGADGLYVAAPIWNEFMNKALAGTPAEQFTRPAGIVEMEVDSLTGKLPTELTPRKKTEIFAEGFNVPVEQDDAHVRRGGKVIIVFRSEKPGDPAWDGPVRTWAASRGYAFSNGAYIVSAPEPEPEIAAGGAGEDETAIPINIRVNPIVSVVPWSFAVEAASAASITVKVDGILEAAATGSALSHVSHNLYPDGVHFMTVEVVTAQGAQAFKVIPLQFSLAAAAPPPPVIPPPENPPPETTTPPFTAEEYQ